MRKDILKKIRSFRKKLDNAIKRTGVNSEECRQLSNKIDKLINKYYNEIEEVKFPEESSTNRFYKESYLKLKETTKIRNKYPTVVEWNNIAKEKGYLSNISLEYISKLDWNYLEIKVKREINLEI